MLESLLGAACSHCMGVTALHYAPDRGYKPLSRFVGLFVIMSIREISSSKTLRGPMTCHYDIVLLTPTLQEATRRRLLRDTVGQRDHLGLGYLASRIEQMGGRVLLVDCLARKLSPRDLANVLSNSTFSLAGLYAYQQHFDDVRTTCSVIKARCPKAPIVLGGNAATLTPARWLSASNKIDGVLLGEGEASVSGLLEFSSGDRDLADVPGMCTCGKITPSVSPPPIDSLPWPVRPSLEEGAKEASIVTVRGCVFQCSFCAVPEFSLRAALPRLRLRSPESVVEELSYLVRGCGVEYVSFVDDLFFGTGRKGVERCHQLITNIECTRLRLEFGITCRTEDVELKLFSRLKQVGLRVVYFGVESLVDDELAHFCKGTSVATNLNALRVCQSLNLRVHIGFVMLHPKVTLEHVVANVRAFYKHGMWEYALKHRLLTRRLYVLRGTPAARSYGTTADGFDYIYSDSRINVYFDLARRLEHQAFFLLLRPAELRLVRAKGLAFIPHAGRQASSSLPRTFVNSSYEELDQWFNSVCPDKYQPATIP